MPFIPKAERHNCRVCGIWKCADCGWQRRPANLQYPWQWCKKCGSLRGQFLPVQHAAPYMQANHDEDAARIHGTETP